MCFTEVRLDMQKEYYKVAKTFKKIKLSVFFVLFVALTFSSLFSLESKAASASGLTAEVYLSNSDKLNSSFPNSLIVDEHTVGIVLNDGSTVLKTLHYSNLEKGLYLTVKFNLGRRKAYFYKAGKRFAEIEFARGAVNLRSLTDNLADAYANNEVSFLNLVNLPVSDKRIFKSFKDTFKKAKSIAELNKKDLNESDLEEIASENIYIEGGMIVVSLRDRRMQTNIDPAFMPEIHSVRVLESKNHYSFIVKGDNFIDDEVIFDREKLFFVHDATSVEVAPFSLYEVYDKTIKDMNTIVFKLSKKDNISMKKVILTVTSYFGQVSTKVMF